MKGDNDSVPTQARVDFAGGFKELVAAVLALAIVGFMLFAMHRMFIAEANISDAQWQHMSAILQVAVGIAGTVTGYYFGRIPAEKAATTAQLATAREARMRGQVEQLRRQFSTPIGGGPVGGGQPAMTVDELRQQITRQLSQLG